MTTRFSLWLLGTAWLGLGCGSAVFNNQCSYDGRNHRVGDTFSSTDGCNQCSCTNSGVACTLRACFADAGSDVSGPVDAKDNVGDVRGAPDAVVVDAVVEDAEVVDNIDGGDCAFDRTYRFRNDGGLVAFQDSSTLSPARLHILARDHFRNALPNMCSRQLACSDPAGADVAEIQQALSHPDVVTALSMTTKPFYGTDSRPIDGTVFIFERDDQRGFTVGSGTVPTGLRALADLLMALQAQTAVTPACANL